ncbi:MAG: GNAT family N-acetyltransferase [Bacillota bacterium]|nr:GNAT family N-acetyltransferase [Bacillota bacterium]
MTLVNESDIPSLKENWKKIFFDSDEYIDLFFEYLFDKSLFLKNDVGDNLVSSAAFIKMNYRLEKEVLPAYYIYAAMTLPEFQGRGLMSGLIKDGLIYFAEKEIPLCTVLPANTSLYRYYERFGFTDAFELNSFQIKRKKLFEKAGPLPTFIWQKQPSRDVFDVLNKGKYSLLRDVQVFRYTFYENQNAGGRLYIGPSGYMFTRKSGLGVIIKDYSADENDFAGAVSTLLRDYPDAQLFTFRFKPGLIHPGHSVTIPSALARIAGALPAVAGLARDNPELSLKFELEDPLIPENNGVYIVENGTAAQCSGKSSRHLTVQMLTKLIMSGGGKAVPYANMMLD